MPLGSVLSSTFSLYVPLYTTWKCAAVISAKVCCKNDYTQIGIGKLQDCGVSFTMKSCSALCVNIWLKICRVECVSNINCISIIVTKIGIISGAQGRRKSTVLHFNLQNYSQSTIWTLHRALLFNLCASLKICYITATHLWLEVWTSESKFWCIIPSFYRFLGKCESSLGSFLGEF